MRLRAPVGLGAIAEVVLAEPLGRLPQASSPESFGFMITIGDQSFSSAVVPAGSSSPGSRNTL